MQRFLPVLLLALLGAAPLPAAGLLLPTAGGAPLDMVDHKVSVVIDEQVAVTRVEQTFRNPTDRALEATYVFPVPRGAAVNKLALWIDGKEVKGEVVEAAKAREIYTDIVRRAQDPGLLEYVDSNLLRLRVYPVPPRGDQKVAVRFTAVNALDAGLIEYTYPLKADEKASRTLEKFTLDVAIRSAHAVHNVYSPTHPVTVAHEGDRVANVHFERKQAMLDRDFQLFYSLGKKDVGLTALCHRPERGEPGHFLLLVSPRAELGKAQQAPRDMVFVLDTSGSMSGAKMEQARKALTFCIDHLGAQDRFAVLSFATTVRQFADDLRPAKKGELARARKWISSLEADGGTAIDAALKAALDLRPADTGRTFTVVFFTDGEPTVGETNPERIVQAVADRNTSHTRIFTFGVGNDVNATLLDRLAERTRAVSTYVRPEEDIEVKVSSLYAKISHPVLTDLKLVAGQGIKLTEVYPVQLPDLFHGGQLVVLGRYTGSGHRAITLTGKMGGQTREHVCEVSFPAKTGDERAFVEGLWARRKVGYLLDEIRRNGERKELVEEIVKLAKKHDITTPYTSSLVVPDTAPRTPVVNNTYLNHGPASAATTMAINNTAAPPGALGGSGSGSMAAAAGNMIGDEAAYTYRSHGYQASAPAAPRPPRVNYAPDFVARPAPQPPYPVPTTPCKKQPQAAGEKPDPAEAGTVAQPCTSADQQSLRTALAQNAAHTGKLAVDFAVQLDALRNQDQLGGTPARKVAGRTCRQVGGAWVDEGLDAKTTRVTVKVLSKAYFRILDRQPAIKEVFQLGSRVVWVTPSGTALVIVPDGGAEALSDDEIDRLFVKK
jgi:Ca-activated chloride channel family protein